MMVKSTLRAEVTVAINALKASYVCLCTLVGLEAPEITESLVMLVTVAVPSRLLMATQIAFRVEKLHAARALRMLIRHVRFHTVGVGVLSRADETFIIPHGIDFWIL